MSVDKQIQNMVKALMGPVVVANVGWGETLPDWIRSQIQMERLAQNMREIQGEKIDEATDAEALAYFYTLSLTRPLGNEGYHIYMFLANKYLKRGESVPLSQNQEQLLKELKRKIFKDVKKEFKRKLRV